VGQPDETSALTAYIRIGGSLEVLGMITISTEFYLGLEYQITNEELWGQAKLTVKVEVLFFSASVELSVERRLAGGGSSSTSAELPDGVTPALARPLALGGPAQSQGGSPAAALASPGGGSFADLFTKEDWASYAGAFAAL
jgi:hypothetical protein